MPNRIIDNTITAELQSNSKDAYIPFSAHSMSPNGNIIGSHFAFKIRYDVGGHLELKASTLRNGNRDRDRYSVRRDSASTDLSIERILVLLSTFLSSV